MAATPKLPQLSSKMSLEALVGYLQSFADGVSKALSRLSLPALRDGKVASGNVDAWPFSVNFTASDVDVCVSHGLGRPPAGFIVTNVRTMSTSTTYSAGHVTIKSGEAAPTASGIYLRAVFSDPVKTVSLQGFVFPVPGVS